MKSTEQKVINFISANNLISKGDKILIALSGGPDSVFALNFFIKYKKKFHIEIAAAHFNHSLRGAESDADEKFVGRLCTEKGIELFSKRIDVKGFAKKNKYSLEEAARILRYKNLDSLAGKNVYDKIVTAHNMSDNTETVLMNLFNGTGQAGMSGIPAVRENIVRPLLCLEKKEILKYLEKEKIEFRIDSSNLKDDFRRNFVRNKIIPLIKDGINPKIDEAVFRTSDNLSRTARMGNELNDYLIGRFVDSANGIVSIDVNLKNLFGGELPGEILKKILERNFDIKMQHKDYAKINSLLKNQKGKKTELSKEITAVREEDKIVIGTKEYESSGAYDLSAGEKIKIGSKSFGIDEISMSGVKYDPSGKTEFIDGSVVEEKFTLRRWKSGDRFKPLGMKSFKKVSDFLTDLKIPTSERKNRLVLINRNQIVWIVGLRIDDRVKLNSKSKKIYKLWVN